MSILTISTLAVLAASLSVDTFAVALTKGATIKRLKRKEKRHIAAVFTSCAIIAPLLGWSVGYILADLITNFDHWIAFILLAGVGAHMAWNGIKPEGEEAPIKNMAPAHIFLTAVATNIDAVAVGIGLAFTELNILLVCLAVAVATIIAVYAGLHLGKRTGKLLGRRAEILGGVVLILLGVKVLLQHVIG